MNLDFFSIMKSNIETDQMPIILESLKTCKNIKFLNLSENCLKNNSNCLASTLKELNFIEVAALNNCLIGQKEISNILTELKDKLFIKELYLSGNEIGDEGMKYMKNNLTNEFVGLRALNLAENNIYIQGAEFLSHFLKSKFQLQYLRLGNNKIRAKGLS